MLDDFASLFDDATTVDWPAVVLAGELRDERRAAYWRAAAACLPPGAGCLQSPGEFELLAANDKLVGCRRPSRPPPPPRLPRLRVS